MQKNNSQAVQNHLCSTKLIQQCRQASPAQAGLLPLLWWHRALEQGRAALRGQQTCHIGQRALLWIQCHFTEAKQTSFNQ